MNIFSRVAFGFSAPAHGLKLIFSSPKNFMYSLIPFLIGVIFIFMGYLAASEYLQPLVTSWTKNIQFLQNWVILQQIVNAFILFFSWIVVSLLNFLAGYLCIILVAGPFYALMVENIFKTEMETKKLRGSLSLVLNMFLLAIVKVLFFTLLGIICFILAFFPVVNLLATFVLLLLVAFDCADYAFEIDYLSLRQRLSFLRRHFWEFTGLSLAILCTGFVPGSFFILLPAFVCGATKMYIQLSQKSV